MTHTQTPWRVGGFDENINRAIVNDTHVIALVTDIGSSDQFYNQQLANAEYIVKAVNSYEELLEAAKEALDVLDSLEYYDEARDMLRKALAKAESK